MNDQKPPTPTPTPAPTMRELGFLAIGHGLVTVGLVALFVTLYSAETLISGAFRWALIFGMAAAGVVLVRHKESRYATAGLVAVGCSLWVIRAITQ